MASKSKISTEIQSQKVTPKEDATLFISRSSLPFDSKPNLSSQRWGGVFQRLKESKNTFLAVLNEAPAATFSSGVEAEMVREPIAYLSSPGLLLPLYEGETHFCKSPDGLITLPGGIPKGEKLASITSSLKDNCFYLKGKELETPLVHGMKYTLEGLPFTMCSFSIDLWSEEAGHA